MTDADKALVAMYAEYLASGTTTLREDDIAKAHALVNSDPEAADLFERIYGDEAWGDDD